MTQRLTTYLIAMLVAVCAWAQDSTAVSQKRHITPVRPSTNVVKQPGRDVSPELIEQYITGDTLAALRKAKDDSLRRSYPRYPRLTSLWLGVNFIDPLLQALGQDYASTDVHATLNMWNRLQPTLELGLGWGKTRPDDLNFTYRAKPRLVSITTFCSRAALIFKPLWACAWVPAHSDMTSRRTTTTPTGRRSSASSCVASAVMPSGARS